MDKKDEIRKAAEDIFKNDPFFDQFNYDNSVIVEIVEHVIRQDHERRDSLECLLKDLVDKLDIIHDSSEYRGLYTLALAHNIKYTGPTYDKELEAARAALDEYEREGW